MKELFSNNIDFHNDVFRNIPSPRKALDFFEDIDDQNEEISMIASMVENLSKSEEPYGKIAEDFHYSRSISYPFTTEPFMKSRFGDGSFGIWYGSIDINTSIAETAYHMIHRENQIEGNYNETIIQERAVYKVQCNAVLIDLSQKRNSYPELISDDYTFTQQIGRRLNQEGHPGLLAPSARSLGVNTVIFNPAVLSNPRNHCYFTYKLFPTGELRVERTPGKLFLKFTKDHFYQKEKQLYV